MKIPVEVKTHGGKRPGAGQKPRDFWDKVAEPFCAHNDCWKWKGWIADTGYGRHHSKRERCGYILAHRYSYEFFNGPIPPDQELDHLCRNRSCVNPTHLEAVPHMVNMERSPLYMAMRRRGPWKTHCKRGHPLSGLNLYHPPTGSRQCRTCKAIRQITYRGKHSENTN